MPTLNDNVKTTVIHGDDILFSNNDDKHHDHVNLRTSGDLGANDIHFLKCNVKILDGDLTTKNIRDLEGNSVITVGTNSIDFNSVSVTNFSLGAGSLNASNVASANGYNSLDLELDAHLALINSKVSQNGHSVNKCFVTSNGGALTTSSLCSAGDLAKIATNGAVDLNTAKTGITATQTSAILTNSSKTGITSAQSSAITANTAKVGITSSQASAILANTAKTGITSSEQSAISANTAKVGITPTQSSAITANTAKTGITSSQASSIVSNTNKTGITSAQSSAITANTSKTGITSSQASEIIANTAKTGITSSQISAISANTNKTGITSSQASAITANTAKTGITSTQANAIIANTNKTGITSTQATAISANTAKVGISSGQANAIIANTNKTGISSSQASLITSNATDITALETKTGRQSLSGNTTVFSNNVDDVAVEMNTTAGDLLCMIKGGSTGSAAEVGYMLQPRPDGKYWFMGTNQTDNFVISNETGTTVTTGGTVLSLTHDADNYIGHRVGIGTTSPASALDIKLASNSGYDGIRLTNLSGNYRTIMYRHPDDHGYFAAYDSNNNAKVLVSAVGNSFFTGGRLGIGITSPRAGLEVTTTAATNGNAGVDDNSVAYLAYYNSIIESFDFNSANYQVSIIGAGLVYAKLYVGASDIRIKKNIVEVNDDLALKKVRDISCCWYNYIDYLSSSSRRTIGFLAQQVKEHLPEAVQQISDFIPNEMKKIHTSWNETKMTSNDLQDVSGIKYRFYVNNDISGNEKRVDLVGDENNCFTFKEKWENVFCYGKEVDDFHTLDKQKLFALNFSATQELDRLVAKLTDRIEVLEAKLAQKESN